MLPHRVQSHRPASSHCHTLQLDSVPLPTMLQQQAVVWCVNSDLASPSKQVIGRGCGQNDQVKVLGVKACHLQGSSAGLFCQLCERLTLSKHMPAAALPACMDWESAIYWLGCWNSSKCNP